MIKHTAEEWEENVKFLLENDPDVIRCHEGGGPEDMIMSLVLTLSRTRRSRDEAIATAMQAGAEAVWDTLIASVTSDLPPSPTPKGRMDE